MKGCLMNLYPLNANGINVYCSDIIVDPEKMHIVYFMSISGYQTAVKGIIANFIESYGFYTTIKSEELYLTRSYLNYTTQTKKLPSGLLHAIIFPKCALPSSDDGNNSFVMFTDTETDVQNLFFLHLDYKTEIPLHPSWKTWLWKTFTEQNWLYELTTLVGTYRGYRVEFIPCQLQELITTAIQSKEPELITCMRRNGDMNHELDFTERFSR